MSDADLRAHLALALVPGLGPKLTRAVLAQFGSAPGAARATAEQFAAVPGVGAKLARKFADGLAQVNVDRELALLARHRVRVCVRGDADYPARLAPFDDAPAVLYTRGAITPADDFAVGIVGSRSCTSYGKRMAETIAAELCAAGYTVISGLARGIDAAAHAGALRAKGRTLAVLAGGLAKIYPPEHDLLAEEIADHGALLTETPMSMDPLPGMFPARNRIISALSQAVVVVEANAQSGALITASHAAEQGREVFAVPGNADNPASAGCLELIRKGARLVRHARDILEDLKGLRADAAPLRPRPPTPLSLFESAPTSAPALPPPPPRVPPAPVPTPPTLSGPDKAVWDTLTGPKHLDELALSTGVPVHELMGVLMTLEMSRLIRKLPGNVFERR